MPVSVPFSVRVAVDLDDVLAQTNLAAAEWHNENYETDMSLDDFYYANYWKNPHWGSVDEATAKIKRYFDDCIMDIKPVRDAYLKLTELRRYGFEFIVITARHVQARDQTMRWLDIHYPGLFKKVIFTGEFYKDAKDQLKFRKTSKLEVCQKEEVLVLIDDSIENAIECAKKKDLTILLFGNYAWNRRISRSDHPSHFLSHAERLEREGHGWWEKEDVGQLPKSILRKASWREVAAWLSKNATITELQHGTLQHA